MAYTTIDKPSDYFNTVLWTGNGNSTRSITGVGFQPDLVWLKGRSIINDHTLYDSVRGAGLNKELSSDGTEAEGGLLTEQYGYITSIDSDGFSGTAGVSGSDPVDYFNESGSTYVAWNWLAGGTASSNTDGSITSSVSANTTAGFSIVSYTGNGTVSTIGHGLGVAPTMIIVKARNYSAQAWPVDCRQVDGILYLNETGAKGSYADSSPFPTTAPTSTVFSVGTPENTNANTYNYIAYCFAEKKGYSKFGSYAGNSSTDGAFIYTGFKPALVIFKSTAGTESWSMVDNKRDTDNVVKNQLFPNLTIAEETTNNVMDFCSNGFKMRNSDSRYNLSGYTYIYMAFAENPFVTSTGIPTTAR